MESNHLSEAYETSELPLLRPAILIYLILHYILVRPHRCGGPIWTDNTATGMCVAVYLL